jgi:type II secretory pathway component PulM
MSDANSTGGMMAAWQRMSVREQRMMMVLVPVVMLILIGGLTWFVSLQMNKRRDNIRTSEQRLTELQAMRAPYEEIHSKQAELQAKLDQAAGSSFSDVVVTATKAAGLPTTDVTERRLPVKDHPDYSELVIDLSFKDVSMDKLMALIEKIEGRQGNGVVRISKLKTKANFQQPDLMDVQLSVSTWRKTSGAAGATGAAKGATP